MIIMSYLKIYYNNNKKLDSFYRRSDGEIGNGGGLLIQREARTN